MNRIPISAFIRLVVSVCGLFVVSALADSQARIVRLSDAQGSVEIDQATGQGYEKAFLNIPIHQGAKLKTASDARAEVELEDGSLIHLTPDTVVQFTALSLRDSGGKASTVDVQQGQAYFSFSGKKTDEFAVTFGQEKAQPTPPAHFRVNVKDAGASLAVFKGDVQIEGPSGEVEVGKKETGSFDFANDGRFELTHNIAEDPSDAWDKEQIEYHEQYQAKSSYSTDYPYAYGVSDLNYYGSFVNLAGYGSCWQPYFSGPGWDPFLDGAWMWDPSFGYNWVSAYPWGWMPYHYGSWMYGGGGSGWCWLPGSPWVTYYVPVIGPSRLLPPRGYKPPQPPAAGGGRIVAVGRGPTSSTLPAKNGPLVVKPGDAGLGIPRGVDDIEEINRDFVRNGQVTLRVSEPRSPGGNIVVTPEVPVATPHVPTVGQGRMGGSKGGTPPAPPPTPPK